MRAKPFKVEKSDIAYYFDRYYFHCIDCGAVYHSGKCDNRTVPYCSECKRKHDKEKALIRKREQKAQEIQEIRRKAIQDFYDKILNFEDYMEPIDLKEGSDLQLYSGKDITEIIVKIKNELLYQ